MRKVSIILCFISLVLTVLFLSGALYMFLHTYYFCSDRDVKTWKDPRWRVFDYNSRQATESEIYNVAEVPVIRKVREVSRRKLRFEFAPPINTGSWKILSATTGEILQEGHNSEIQFPNEGYIETFILHPEGIDILREIKLKISLEPAERNIERGLSWPDNYWVSYSSVPFSTKRPYSIDEWAGMSERDPAIIEARNIISGHIDMNAPTVERSEQVFRFIMDRIKDSDGTPTDEVQAASPLKHITF